jgi:hypothetical protein
MELPWIYVDIIKGRLNLIGWLLSAISSNPTDRTYWPVLNLRVAYFGQYPGYLAHFRAWWPTLKLTVA